MKLQAAIFCLLAVAKFGVCKPTESSTEKLSEDEVQAYEHRWSLESTPLERGLKIKSGEGELVELNLANETLRREAMARLQTNVRFLVYTNYNPTEPVEFDADEEIIRPQLRSSYFDAARPTIFITHGWKNNGSSEVCTRIRDAYFKNSSVNVIVVDWSDVRVHNYEYAARQSLFIGDKISEMIHVLNRRAHMYLTDVTLVGHSMGAHIMGIAGYQTNGEVDTIFGLDPALPLFTEAGSGYGLSTTDAEYVQVIHTNAGHLGYADPIGHADFYVNDGMHQKGCNADFACSHSRAYEYFAESISSPDSFYGLKFDSYRALRATLSSPLGYVTDTKIEAKMGGYPAEKNMHGIYYVGTRQQSPYGLGKHDGKKN